MIILSHPTANQNVRQTALAFASAGLLEEFWTCVSWRENGALDHLFALAPRVRRDLQRRSLPQTLRPFIRTHGFREWGRHVTSHLGWSKSSFFSIDAVYRALDRRVARRLFGSLASKAVYAYEDGALDTFRAARKRGICCIYEHPVVHWRLVQQYQREEAELSPAWKPTLTGLSDREEKLARKDEELALANMIITPSSVSRDSLALAKGVTAPVHVIPYGMCAANEMPSPSAVSRKLRVIFVGALSQAKGLGYLLEAVSRLSEAVTLTIVGRRISPVIPNAASLQAHRWIPSLSHEGLLEEMRQQDALILPSLHEGFGLVLGEAMGQGLVVITTPHTAGPDLITDGVDGFLIPIRSPEAIEEKLLLLHRDRVCLRAMQEAAWRRAKACSWENYRQALVKLARDVIGK